jgi:hypothetical protein
MLQLWARWHSAVVLCYSLVRHLICHTRFVKFKFKFQIIYFRQAPISVSNITIKLTKLWLVLHLLLLLMIMTNVTHVEHGVVSTDPWVRSPSGLRTRSGSCWCCTACTRARREAQRLRIMAAKLSVRASANISDALQYRGRPISILNALLYWTPFSEPRLTAQTCFFYWNY